MSNTTESKIILNAEDRTAAAFNSAAANANALIGRLAGLAIAKEAAEAMWGLVNSSINAGDQLAKMSDQLGMTTERLAALHYAGELAGMSAEMMDKNLTKMSRSLAEAAAGGGPAADAFARLHLNASELAKLPLDQAFDKISASMGEVHNANERTMLSMEMFGKSGARMSILMTDGAASLAEAAKEAEGLGLTLNRVDAAKLEIANDSFFRMGSIVKGVGNNLALALTPAIKGVADYLVKAATDAGGFKDGITTAVNAAITALGWLLDAFNGLLVVWTILEAGWASLGYVIVGGIAQLDKAIVDTLNHLPGVHLQVNAELEKMAMDFATNLEKTLDKLDTRLMAPPPSVGLKKFVEEAVAATEEGAKIIADRSEGLRQNEEIMVEQVGTDLLTAYMAQLDALDIYLTSDEELRMQKHERDRSNLEDQLGNQFITEEQYLQRRALLTQKYEEDLTAIKARENAKRTGVNAYYDKLSLDAASFTLGAMSNLMNSHSKKQFEIGKKAAIAQTVINTYKAAMGAYSALSSIYIVGPILGAIAAAAIIVSGMSQVSNIRSQQFEGGGGGGGTPPIPTVESNPNTGEPAGTPGGDVGTVPARSGGTPAPARQVNIYLQSDSGVLSAEYVRDTLIPAINEAAGDGVTINVGMGS